MGGAKVEGRGRDGGGFREREREQTSGDAGVQGSDAEECSLQITIDGC